MKLLRIRKLDSGGFIHHFILPILAVLVVGAIGAYVLNQSHAATASYYTTICTKVTSGPPNSTYNQCTQDAQILLNAAQHHDGTNELGLSVYAGSTFNYGTTAKPMVYLLMNGLYGTYTAKAVTSATGNSAGQLTSGTTGSWQHLCTIAASKGLSSDSSALNFAASGDHGVTGGSITYLKAPVSNSAAFSYACGKASSTPPTTASAPLCTSYTVSMSSNPTPSGSKCVYYIQTILNSATASNPFSYNSYASNYDKYYGISGNGAIGGVNTGEKNYNQETSVRVMAFQATVAYNGTPLTVSGTTDGPTWSALCALAHSYGTTPNTSAIQTARAVGTASDSGCAAVIGKITSDPHQTTPPPLSCSGGSSMNSAKTACACPSGQTYSGGTCSTPSAPPAGCTSNCGGLVPTITSFAEINSIINRALTYPYGYALTWTSINATSCSVAIVGSGYSAPTPSTAPNSGESVNLRANTPYAITLTCSNSVGHVSKSARIVTGS